MSSLCQIEEKKGNVEEFRVYRVRWGVLVATAMLNISCGAVSIASLFYSTSKRQNVFFFLYK